MRSDAGPWYSREFLSAYISGYADGEGCFTVSISPRSSLRTGWEVRPSFSVSQNGDRAEVLYVLQTYFGCGSIRPDRSDRTLKWETRRLDELVNRVVPHFVAYPLLSGKQFDFERFALVCRLMADGDIEAGKVWSRSSQSRGEWTQVESGGTTLKLFSARCSRVKG
jgi:LAGLIDADG endonuclease